MHRLLVLVLASVVLFGCHHETIEDSSPPRPVEPTPAETAPPRVLGPIEMAARTEGVLSGDAAPVGYVVTLAHDARVSATVTSTERVELIVYGPLAGTWADAPIAARGEGRVELTVPAAGTYLFAVRGPASSTAAFTVELACGGAECREECGAELTCPAGATCAVVMCIRAPCPSYCQAQTATAPVAALAGCERGGCGGELCHEPGEGRASICVARPEHACYRTAACVRQPDGACGFTDTPELRACLASPPAMQ